jgi:hypothetical protein
LKRVFGIDIETCSECGGDVRIIAGIEDPVVIRKILAHLDAKGIHVDLLPQCRAPPVIGFSPRVSNSAKVPDTHDFLQASQLNLSWFFSRLQQK